DLLEARMGIYRDGSARPMAREPGRPPRIDGYIVGWNLSDPNDSPRHGGELHPDADEVLVIVAGRMEVLLEEDGAGPSSYSVGVGQSIVVPKGTWHRTRALEPGTILVNITPGPHGDWRPV